MVMEYLAGVWLATLVILSGLWLGSEMTAGEKRALDGYVKGL